MPAEYVQKIRDKFPGAYDDLSDQELAQKVIAKYPDYSDILGDVAQGQVAPPQPSPAAPVKTPPDGVFKKIGRGVAGVVGPVYNSVLNRATEGIEEIIAPPAPNEGLGASALRGLLGGLKTMTSPAAPAGDYIGAPIGRYIGERGAARAEELRRRPPVRGYNPHKGVYEEVTADIAPIDPKQAEEGGRLLAETAAGFVPGYAGASRWIERGRAAAKALEVRKAAEQAAALARGSEALELAKATEAQRIPGGDLYSDRLAAGGENVQASMQPTLPLDRDFVADALADDRMRFFMKEAADNADTAIASRMSDAAVGGQQPENATDVLRDRSATAAQTMNADAVAKGGDEVTDKMKQGGAMMPRDWELTFPSGLDITKLGWAVRNPAARGTLVGGTAAMTGEDTEDAVGKGLVGFAAGALSTKRGRELLRDSPIGGVYRHTLQRPDKVVKGVPEAEAIVESGIRAQAVDRAIYNSMRKQIETVYKGLNRTEIEEVNKVLDGVATPSSSATATAAQQARAMLDEWASYNGIEAGKRLSEYFPHIRDEVYVTGKQIEIGPEKYIPKEIDERLSRRVAPFMLKRRTLEDAATDYTLGPLDAYAKATARHIALKGGETQLTGQVTGFIPEIQPHLGNIPDRLAEYVGTYTNDILGVPRGSNIVSPGAANDMRTYQFGRLIAGNPKTPVENLGQMFLNFVESTPSSWVEGGINTIRNLFKADPKLKEMLDRIGISVSGINKMDHSSSTPVTRYEKAVDKASLPFRGSEYVNQSNAAFTGIPEAKLRGLVGREAEEYARKFTNKTQFNYGTSNLPTGWRSGTTGPLLTQMKQYALHYTNWVTDLVKNDTTQLVKGAPEAREAWGRMIETARTGDKAQTYRQFEHVVNSLPYAKTAKYFVLGSILFGPEAMFGSLDKHLSSAVTGDPNALRMKKIFGEGVIPSMGLYMGQMFGMGSLPAEDFRSLAFFLPGPAASLLLDAASLGATMASLAGGGNGKTFNFSLENFEIHEGVDWETVASKATKLAPFGITLDRLRKGVVQQRAEDPKQVRRPATLSQSFGVDAVPRTARPIRSAVEGETLGVRHEAAKTALGFQSTDQHDEMEFKRQSAGLQEKSQQIMKYATEQAVVGKDISRGQAILDKFNKINGTNLVLKPEHVKNFLKNTQLDTPVRTLRRAPKATRPRILDLQKELMGD